MRTLTTLKGLRYEVTNRLFSLHVIVPSPRYFGTDTLLKGRLHPTWWIRPNRDIQFFNDIRRHFDNRLGKT